MVTVVTLYCLVSHGYRGYIILFGKPWLHYHYVVSRGYRGYIICLVSRGYRGYIILFGKPWLPWLHYHYVVLSDSVSVSAPLSQVRL